MIISGNSTNCANTSEDSVSDLDSDNDLQVANEKRLAYFYKTETEILNEGYGAGLGVSFLRNFL